MVSKWRSTINYSLNMMMIHHFHWKWEKLNVKMVLEPLINCFMEIVGLEIYWGKNVMH